MFYHPHQRWIWLVAHLAGLDNTSRCHPLLLPESLCFRAAPAHDHQPVLPDLICKQFCLEETRGEPKADATTNQSAPLGPAGATAQPHPGAGKTDLKTKL